MKNDSEHDSMRKDLLCVGAILAILCVRFFKTLFFAKSISKLFLLSQWDSLFYSLRSGPSLYVDPSLIEQHLPCRFFVAACWHHGVPLWNELSGFGMPLLADPQAFVLSPIFALFYFFPSMHAWNCDLIIRLAIGAVSIYFLSRELELSFIGALTAALLFIFCPYIQWHVELLGNGYCLIPFVFLFFVRAAKRKSLWHAVLAGVAAAIDLLSAHPEVAFTTIMFACLLMCLVAYYRERSNFRFLPIFRRISLAGLVAFGLSAPLLIPFLEYLYNGHTYKFGGPAAANISWQDLLANFVYPFSAEGSPFIGPLSWWGLALTACFLNKINRFAQAIFICLIISVAAVCQLFPLNLLFQIPPFSMIWPSYWLVEYLVLIVIVSGLGVSSLLNGHLGQGIESTQETPDSPAILFSLPTGTGKVLSFTIVLALLIVPLIFSHRQNNFFYPGLPSNFDLRLWLFNAACALAMPLIWAATMTRTPPVRTVGAIVIVMVGFSSLILVSFNTLRLRPSFQYPAILPLQFSQPANSRMLALGDHLFRPNTNIVYGLATARVWNPLFPKGLAEFMQACGAQEDQFSQYFSASISRLLDLTGTRTIVSEQPLLDEGAIRHKQTLARSLVHKNLISKRGVGEDVTPRVTYANLLSLSNIELFRDSQANTVFCRFTATPRLPQSEDYHVYFDIKDDRGATAFTCSEPQLISVLFGKQTITCSGFTPVAKHWTLSLRIAGGPDSSHLIRPTSTTLGKLNADGSWLIGTSDQKDLFSEIDNSRFKFLSSCYGGNKIAAGPLSYENKTALNHYFFGEQIKWVDKRAAALDYLKTHTDELSNVVVLEDWQKKKFAEALMKTHMLQGQEIPIKFDKSAEIKKLDTSSRGFHLTSSSPLALQVECLHPALLVVCDLYYPGWKATIDGSACSIFRADYLFRAVPVPAGKHIIRFEYQPLSFMIGLALFLLTIVALIAFSSGPRIGARKTNVSSGSENAQLPV